MKTSQQNNGIKRCQTFREIRKRMCENNGLPYREEECPEPNPHCTGTCPACDFWLERLSTFLDLKKRAGEEIDYSGIKEIYQLMAQGE